MGFKIGVKLDPGPGSPWFSLSGDGDLTSMPLSTSLGLMGVGVSGLCCFSGDRESSLLAEPSIIRLRSRTVPVCIDCIRLWWPPWPPWALWALWGPGPWPPPPLLFTKDLSGDESGLRFCRGGPNVAAASRARS